MVDVSERVEDELSDFAPVDVVRGLELDEMVIASTAWLLFPRSEPAGEVGPVDMAREAVEKSDGESSPLVVVEVDEMEVSEGVRDTGFESSSGIGGGLGAVREDLERRGRRADARAWGSSMAVDERDMRGEEMTDERGV